MVTIPGKHIRKAKTFFRRWTVLWLKNGNLIIIRNRKTKTAFADPKSDYPSLESQVEHLEGLSKMVLEADKIAKGKK